MRDEALVNRWMENMTEFWFGKIEAEDDVFWILGKRHQVIELWGGNGDRGE